MPRRELVSRTLTRDYTFDINRTSIGKSTHILRPRVAPPSLPRGQRCSPAVGESAAAACRLSAAGPCHPGDNNPARDVSVTRHQQGFPGSRPIRSFPSPVAAMAGATALGLFRELRTQPVRNRPRTSRRGQVEHKPVASPRHHARPPQPAHSPRATSCRNPRPPRRFPARAAPSFAALLRQGRRWKFSPPLESSAPHGARGSRLSLISSLIHVRAPASITVYYRRSEQGLIDRHGRSWTVILHPEKRKVEVLRAAPFYAGAVPLSAFPAQ